MEEKTLDTYVSLDACLTKLILAEQPPTKMEHILRHLLLNCRSEASSHGCTEISLPTVRSPSKRGELPRCVTSYQHKLRGSYEASQREFRIPTRNRR